MNAILSIAVLTLAAVCISLQMQVIRLRATTQKQIELTDQHIAQTNELITSVHKLIASSGAKGQK